MYSEPSENSRENNLQSDDEMDDIGLRASNLDHNTSYHFRDGRIPDAEWCNLDSGPSQIYVKQIARMMYAAGDTKNP